MITINYTFFHLVNQVKSILLQMDHRNLYHRVLPYLYFSPHISNHGLKEILSKSLFVKQMFTCLTKEYKLNRKQKNNFIDHFLVE